MKHTWIVLAALFVVTTGCHQPPPPPQQAQLMVPPTLARGWTFTLDKSNPITAMYCRDQDVFAYTHDGTSYVLERKTGRLQQIDVVPDGTGSMPAPLVLKDSIAYATPQAVQLYDLRGNLTRTIPLRYTLTSGIGGLKDTLFVAEAFPGGGRVAALDLTLINESVRWEYLVPHAGIVSTPIVVKDAVYIAAEDGTVAALATVDREPIWPIDNGVFKTGDAIVADLAADDYGVYAASYDSELYCLNPNNGKLRWKYYAQAPLTAAPVATTDLVFEFVQGVGVVAIDKKSTGVRTNPVTFDRTPRWTAANCIQVLAEDQNYVYLLRSDHHISARDKDTGAEVFASKRSDFAALAINNTDGTIYAALTDGEILSINAVTLPGIVGKVVLDDTRPLRGISPQSGGSLALARVGGGQ